MYIYMAHIADHQVREPVGVVEARVARGRDRGDTDRGRQRHVGRLDYLLLARLIRLRTRGGRGCGYIDMYMYIYIYIYIYTYI